MSFTNDISSSIGKISQIENDMKNEEKKITSEVQASKNWWTGRASEAFSNRYKEDESQIIKVHSNIGDLKSALKRLITEVDSADAERRRIEAEKKRQEQEKSKNKSKR